MFPVEGAARLAVLSNEPATSPSLAALQIHPDLRLKGQLSTTRDVILTGHFDGDLRTKGRLSVPAGGSAVGTIEAGALSLEPGNAVEARVKVVTVIEPVPQKKPAATPLRQEAPVSRWSSRLKKLKDLALGRSG